jgi:hypothetical protein
MVSVADTKLPYKNNIYSDPEPIIHSDTKPWQLHWNIKYSWVWPEHP